MMIPRGGGKIGPLRSVHLSRHKWPGGQVTRIPDDVLSSQRGVWTEWSDPSRTVNLANTPHLPRIIVRHRQLCTQSPVSRSYDDSVLMICTLRVK